MIQKRVLRIELKSDISAGSGYSYAGLIDRDISYDQYGIPVILGRRLKGCMRETAENELYQLLSDKEIGKIFGISKNNRIQGIIVDNAYPEGTQALRHEIEVINTTENKSLKDFRRYVSQNEILNSFTSVKAQTAIEKASRTAKTNSLRYMRIVNDISPLNGKPLVFEAEIQFDDKDIDIELEKKLEKIVKATRNIGQSRNRGLGSVRCILLKKNLDVLGEESRNNACNRVISAKKGPKKAYHDNNSITEIPIIVKNEQPLMISGMNDNESLSYIPGQAVLGALAGKYLNGNPVIGDVFDDSAFRALFLSGDTIFTDLVPYANGMLYHPAPLFIRTLKKTKKYINAEYLEEVVKTLGKRRKEVDSEPADDIEISLDYQPLEGNTAKKLSGKYVYIKNSKQISVHEVATDLVYHHSHQGTNNGEEGKLFPLEVIREQQFFAGRIIVPKQHEKKLRSLLSDGVLRFGKSKTAQYGKCTILQDINISTFDYDDVIIPKGSAFLVQLVSDAIFVNDMDYTTEYGEVKLKIAKHLKLSADNACDSEKFHDMIEIDEKAGYHVQWNLRKAPVPVVKAGSVFVFEAKEKLKVESAGFVGERNHEGFGEYRIFVLAGDYKMEIIERENNSENSETGTEQLIGEVKFGSVHDILKESVLEQMSEKLRMRALNKNDLNLSASHISRLMLMLIESTSGNKSGEDSFADFQERIESVKNREREKMRAKVLEEISVGKDIDDENNDDDKKLWSLNEVYLLDGRDREDRKFSIRREYDLLKRVFCMKEAESAEVMAKEELFGLWKEYVRALLINVKYQMKEQ